MEPNAPTSDDIKQLTRAVNDINRNLLELIRAINGIGNVIRRQ